MTSPGDPNSPKPALPKFILIARRHPFVIATMVCLIVQAVLTLQLIGVSGRHVSLTGEVVSALKLEHEQIGELAELDGRIVRILGKIAAILESQDSLLSAIQGGDKDAQRLAELMRSAETRQKEMKEQFEALSANSSQLVLDRVETLETARKELENRVSDSLRDESNKVLAFGQITSAFVIGVTLVVAILFIGALRSRGQAPP